MLNHRNNISSSLPLRSAGQEAVNLPIKKWRVNRNLRDLESLTPPQSGHYCSQAETENTHVGRAEFYYKFTYIYWNVYSPYFPLSRNIFHLLTFPNHRKIKKKKNKQNKNLLSYWAYWAVYQKGGVFIWLRDWVKFSSSNLRAILLSLCKYREREHLRQRGKPGNDHHHHQQKGWTRGGVYLIFPIL